MSWLEVNSELLNNIEEQTVATGGVLTSGVYSVKIDNAFLRKTESGATMFELECTSHDDKKVFWNTCAKTGDAKGNKSTYTDKQGKEQLLPGIISMAHLFEVCGTDIAKETPTGGKVEFKGNPIEAGIFKGLVGKQFKACVRQYESEYNGDITIKYDIENFLDLDGRNKKGEELETKFMKKIEGSPIKLLKKATPNTNAVAAAAVSGWA